ncbi:MAG: hypothetical protein JW801_01290 [Bacteroidales bacterium]|nr:hypothetical protein [Bacteroidales bacterium]
MIKKFLITGLVLSLFLSGYAQNYYRISGEYSIKGKSETAAQLVMGKFYYDKNEGTIIHENYFPKKETWITSDTSLYQIIDGAIATRQTIPDFSDFSIYHMVLNNQLDNFGLEESDFTLESVENSEGMVITTWSPSRSMKDHVGKIMISSKNKNMYGIIFFSTEDKIIKKQFFEDYVLAGGLTFPGRIVEITYSGEKEVYQVTTYKNIRVNDTQQDQLYHFDPANFKQGIRAL